MKAPSSELKILHQGGARFEASRKANEVVRVCLFVVITRSVELGIRDIYIYMCYQIIINGEDLS